MYRWSLQRELVAGEEREFHGLLVPYVSSLFVSHSHAPPMNHCRESITQQPTSHRLEELTKAHRDMQQQLKVGAEEPAQLLHLFGNNKRASDCAGKRSSSSTGVKAPTVAEFAAGVHSTGAATSATRRDATKRAKGSTPSSTNRGGSGKETSSTAVPGMETGSADASTHMRAEQVAGAKGMAVDLYTTVYLVP